MTCRSEPWRARTASSRGAGHQKAGLANQDAVSHAAVIRPDGSALLAVALADGHGDVRHFRSQRGSALAVTAGIGAITSWSAAVPAPSLAIRPLAIKHSVESMLIPSVVAHWNRAVAMDLAADPLTEQEETRLGQRLGQPPAVPRTAYGSTLLLAVLTGEVAIFAQIGDGDIVAVTPDGQSIRPVPDDDRLDGWRTTSLCQPDPVASFRIGVVPLAACPLFAVLLATDGFGNAQQEERWEPAVAADLAELGREAEDEWFDAQVPRWASECASGRGSGDDVTLALLTNRAARPRPVAAPAPAGAADTVVDLFGGLVTGLGAGAGAGRGAAAAGPRPRRGRRWVLGRVAAALVLLAAVAILLLVTGVVGS